MSDIDSITDRADKIARIIMDQLAADGCANLENIRNALLAPLIAGHREDVDGGMAAVIQGEAFGPAKPKHDIGRCRPHSATYPAKDIPVSIEELARECVSEYESIVRSTPQGWWGDVKVAGIRPQIFHFKPDATNTGLSAEAMTHRNEAIAKARATGKPQTVSIDLDLMAMPDGSIIHGYDVGWDGENDCVEGVRQKAKIIAPVLSKAKYWDEMSAKAVKMNMAIYFTAPDGKEYIARADGSVAPTSR